MKYRKKPVIIEAIQWTGDNYNEMDGFITVDHGYQADFGGNLGVAIPTLEGVMIAQEGDYIIKGVNGEFYPCKPDIFVKTYDSVEK